MSVSQKNIVKYKIQKLVLFAFNLQPPKTECIRHCLVANEIWSLFFGIGKTRKFTYIIVELELELDVTAFHLYS